MKIKTIARKEGLEEINSIFLRKINILENNTKSNQYTSLPKGEIEGEITWKSPSNIAFIKYWGKYGVQLPKNASLSMSLEQAFSTTSIRYAKAKSKAKREFLFEGKQKPSFAKRIWKHIDSLNHLYPYLKEMDLSIESSNSFPHSTGIASSASAMSALALCLADMERIIFGSLEQEKDFFQKASYLARLGSGSASRSVYGGFSIWGETKDDKIASDNDFAIPYNKHIHTSFRQLKDAILIVDQAEKKVSSSLGHSLMDNHPYAESRLIQANKNINKLIKALAIGDKENFIQVLESEAMSLHALMMTSEPWFILMKAQTMKMIEKIRAYREETRKFITFTMDAGPNVHLIYEADKDITTFIEKELKALCANGYIIFDKMGSGPQKIN